MPVESAADLATFFNADEFGVEAVYTPPGGGVATACVILVNDVDPDAQPGDGRPIIGQKLISVRRAQLATPAHEGTFVVPGATYTVVGRPRLEAVDGAIWVMNAR